MSISSISARCDGLLKAFGLALWMVATGSVAAPKTAAAPVVSFHYPPFFQEDRGVASGYVVEAYLRFVQGSSFEQLIEFVPLARAQSQLRSGVSLIGLGSRDQHRDHVTSGVLTAHRLASSPFVLFRAAGKGGVVPTRLAELQGLKVCGQYRSAALPLMAQAGVRVETGLNLQASIRMVLEGRCAYGFGSGAAIERAAAQMGLTDRVQILDFVFMRVSADILVHRDHPQAAELNRRLEAGIQRALATGELQCLAQKYFGPDAPTVLTELWSEQGMPVGVAPLRCPPDAAR